VAGAPDPPVNLRNLTTSRYGVSIPAGERESLTYAFATEMHPQELTLSIAAVLQGASGDVYTKQVYNETVSVVEAPMSFFDPQMYAHTHLPTQAPINTALTASSSTSSSSQPSAAPATSSTTPGSRLSSRKSAAAARAASALSALRAGRRRSIPRSRFRLWVLMDPRLRRAARGMMRVGFRRATCRDRRLGVWAVDGRRVGRLLRWGVRDAVPEQERRWRRLDGSGEKGCEQQLVQWARDSDPERIGYGRSCMSTNLSKSKSANSHETSRPRRLYAGHV